MPRSTAQPYTLLLILSLLLALGRLALDLLAQLSGKPPEVQNTMDVILIVALALALGHQERQVAAATSIAPDPPGYSKFISAHHSAVWNRSGPDNPGYRRLPGATIMSLRRVHGEEPKL
jgi:hypothetical protein